VDKRSVSLVFSAFFDVLDQLPHFSEQTYPLLAVSGPLKFSKHLLALRKALFKAFLRHRGLPFSPTHSSIAGTKVEAS
jgi:hypothetical protein